MKATKMRFQKGFVGLSVAAALGLTTSCSQSNVAQPDSLATQYYKPDRKTLVHGYVWDPEAFLYSLFACNPADPCGMEPPENYTSTSALRRSLVQGAQVTMLDSTGASAGTSNVTDEYGTWTAPRVKSDDDNPYSVTAVAPAGASIGEPPPLDPMTPWAPLTPPVPQANSYFPTDTVRPIVTSEDYCYIHRVTVMADDGVLEAVAKQRTADGTPTSVSDLTDPTKFGGVVVWLLTQPGDYDQTLNAGETSIQFSVGETYSLAWAAPGTGPATQSTRGFYVAGMTDDPIGMFVDLLPPSSQPTEVQLTPTDTVTDLGQMRPWAFDPSDIVVRPQVITFGWTEAASDFSGPPSEDYCLPMSMGPGPGPGGP